MPHIPERLLGLYALDPAVSGARAEIEAHVASCAECTALLEEIRAFDQELTDPDNWPQDASEPDDKGIDELRRFAARLAREDAEAAALLSRFDDAPAARFAWADLPSKHEYRTAGIVRALCKRAFSMSEREPLYGLALAETATEIACALDDSEYPRGTVHQWRGDALKEQANAQRFLGRLTEALVALDGAEAEYQQVRDGGLGMVAVDYVRATVLFEQDQFDGARELANRSAAAAERLGDQDRIMRARDLEGEILFEQGAFQAASEVFQAILRFGEEQRDPSWIARESMTLGNCFVELGKPTEARRHLDRALTLYSSLDYPVQLARTKWALARADVFEGRTRPAVLALRSCIATFTHLGMLTDAGLVALDLAEVLLAMGKTAEIPPLLTSVVHTFTNAGKLTGALAAFAYIRTAAATKTLTPAAVSHVRHFVARADRHPELLFVPPPGGAL